MSRQLVQEYHFVRANGHESEARWRKSLTPYQRASLDRALAYEAEERAHPLPADPEPVAPVGWQAIGPYTAANLLAAFQRSSVFHGMTAATRAQSSLNDVLSFAREQLHTDMAIDRQLERLATSTGQPIDVLRERFREYAASLPVPRGESIWSFCAMVERETSPTVTVVQRVIVIVGVDLATRSLAPVEPAQPQPRRSFKDGLRRRWWDR